MYVNSLLYNTTKTMSSNLTGVHRLCHSLSLETRRPAKAGLLKHLTRVMAKSGSRQEISLLSYIHRRRPWLQ